jgi:hypothetical protein
MIHKLARIQYFLSYYSGFGIPPVGVIRTLKILWVSFLLHGKIALLHPSKVSRAVWLMIANEIWHKWHVSFPNKSFKIKCMILHSLFLSTLGWPAFFQRQVYSPNKEIWYCIPCCLVLMFRLSEKSSFAVLCHWNLETFYCKIT